MQFLKRIEFSKKHRKYLYRSILSLVVIFNILAYLGAYTLTHYVSPGQFGLGKPKPNSTRVPTDLRLNYITQRIPIGQNEWLETWFIPVKSTTSKGTVILFPGSGGSKAKQLLQPFTRLVDAVGSRLQAISIPTFPLAQLTVLWGSIQHGFNGFAHNPEDYASQVDCPTLILHGKLDKWTTVAQIDRLDRNLRGTKQLSIFPNAGHNLLVSIDRDRWTQDIEKFLKEVKLIDN
jgi:pimeloyl-ACP methyl ester carboxylesterase